MPTTRAQTIPQPTALFEACLRGNVSMVARLLEGPGTDTLLREAPCGFTVLHAAVLGGPAAVPAMPLLAADGVDIDSQLDFGQGAAPLEAFLQSFGVRFWYRQQATPLALACRMHYGAAVQQLLRLGASPAAGAGDGSALSALEDGACYKESHFQQILLPFLRHGLDPLAPEWRGPSTRSLLLDCQPDMRGYLLEHLQGLHSAGQLQLASKCHAAQLVLGAASSGKPMQQAALVAAGITALQGWFGVTEPGAAPATPAPGSLDAQLLDQLLRVLIELPEPGPLLALLGSRLPLNLQMRVPPTNRARQASLRGSLVARAAISPTAHWVNCRLLRLAGAPLTADDLYNCIDQLSRKALEALLCCGVPTVDTSQPVNTPQQPQASVVCYSCPIHRALHKLTQAQFGCEPASDLFWKTEWFGLRIVEALLAAGYRPCAWQHVRMPAFLQPTHRERVLPVLDPFLLYDPVESAVSGLPMACCYLLVHPADFSQFKVTKRVEFVARGGRWSPETHRHWPERFKATAQAFLLTARAVAASRCAAEGAVTRARSKQRSASAAAIAAASSSEPAGCCLGDLPQEVLLHILGLAAMPLSSWLPPRPAGAK